MNQQYLNVNNLSFEYPDGFKALENINLSLSKGERLAVLGPNGAGKTTLILHPVSYTHLTLPTICSV